jgi:hypothetical protein
MTISVTQSPDIQNTGADKPSYYLTGTNDITISNNANLKFGNGDFTCLSMFKLSQFSASLAVIAQVEDGAAKGFDIGVTSSGLLRSGLNSGGTDLLSGANISLNTIYSVVLKRDGSSVTQYLNGIINGQITSSKDFGTTNPYFRIGNATAAFSLYGNTYRNILFNYALSEDKIKRYSAGAKLDWEDVGGSMTDLVNGLTWANVNYNTFNVSGNDLTSVVGTINQYGRIGFINSPNASLIPIVAGKRYRLYYTLTSTGATLPSVVFMTGTDSVVSSPFVALPVATNGYVEIIPTITNNACLRIQAGDGSVNCVLTIDKLVQLGAVLDLEPENITEGTWFDASPNGLHGTVTGAIANRFIPSYSSRNYIINGGMDFDQRRGFTASSPYTSGGTWYVSDRFKLEVFGTVTGSYTIQTIADAPTSFTKSGKVTSGGSGFSATLGSFISHSIEGFNSRSLLFGTSAAKTITLSFWVKSTTVGTMSVTFYAINGFRNYITEVKINNANTWEFKSVTIKGCQDGAWNKDETLGLKVIFGIQSSGSWLVSPTNVWNTANAVFSANQTNFIASASNSVQITGVMLNEGPVAAPFELSGGTIAGELAMCQRYYEKSFDLSTPPTQGPNATTFYTEIGATMVMFPYRIGSPSGSYVNRSPVLFKVPKRATPTVTLYGNNTGLVFFRSDTSSTATTGWGSVGAYPNQSGFELGNEVDNASKSLIAYLHWDANAEI